MSPNSHRALAVKKWRVVWFAAVATAAIGTAGAVDVPVTDFQGAWAAGVTYAPGAIVTYQGASYISIVQSTHFAPPTHPAYWKVIDPAGAVGPAGPPGPQGPAGPAGPPGTTGIFGGTSTTSYGQGTQGVECNLGTLLLTATLQVPAGYALANGALLDIQSNIDLFQVLGTNFGGDGVHTFGLPNLQNAAPLNTTYLICVTGVFP